MKRLILPILAGVVLGGIVHLVGVLLMPYVADQDAYARLAAVGELNTVTGIDDPRVDGAVLPASDPAFVTAVCLYDLADGPVKIQVPPTDDYTSISFYTRYGLPFYAINDRSAGRSLIVLDLMTAKQRAALPEDADVTAADRLVVESPSLEGVVLIRALVRERGAREQVRMRLDMARCSGAS